MTHTDLIARLRSQKNTDEMERHEIINADFEGAYNLLIRDCRSAADALTAAQERIEALEGALIEWNMAFGMADGYAVAIHDADGKCYSVRAQDYNVLHDLYRSRAALDAGRDG